MTEAITGTREWLGGKAEEFLRIRNAIENNLRHRGYSFFYSGLLSDMSIYEDNIDLIGKSFLNNCIRVKVNSDRKHIIVSPEGTFKVYNHLSRNKLTDEARKVFYSQEFLRNESAKDVSEGKTISFWQAGFEICDQDKFKASIEALDAVIDCFNKCGLSNVIYRITDKRLLDGLIGHLQQKHQDNIYRLLAASNDNGDVFESNYMRRGGSSKLAKKIAALLNMQGTCGKELDSLDKLLNGLSDAQTDAIIFLKQVSDAILSIHPDITLEIIPFMSKSWNCCPDLMFDARLPNYMYAIAGGGNLQNLGLSDQIFSSGAGMGVTRIVEYLTSQTQQ